MSASNVISVLHFPGLVAAPPFSELAYDPDGVTVQWRGKADFTVRFDASDCPFTGGECEFPATRSQSGNYETASATISGDAKFNRPYKYVVEAGTYTSDPIIIIRTIQYFQALADESSLKDA